MADEFNFGDIVWYDGGAFKAYKPGVYKIVDFFTELNPILKATTISGKRQRVVAQPNQIRKLTEQEKILYGR